MSLKTIRNLMSPSQRKSRAGSEPECKEVLRGSLFAREWPLSDGCHENSCLTAASEPDNPIRRYFDNHTTGRGIWKPLHFFDLYHRHFSKFIGCEVHILEIGIFSGGSLDMWKDYFGSGCYVYGVDIQPACNVYEDERTKIFIGDQADRDFWKMVKAKAPTVDILIDDGGHYSEQQIVSLEEMLPHLRPGGVYFCEDVNGIHNQFAAYVYGLSNNLNAEEDNATNFQKAIHSVHLYPFAIVVEKNEYPIDGFPEQQHGDEWQPRSFLFGSPTTAPDRNGN